ncbi:RNA-directed DNA polymerase, eukaryota, reverse transcriptase zinc-binding domain protein [Tanacetum coccineum]
MLLITSTLLLKKNGLIDLPLGGRLFTWMNKVGTNISKLDRFLISKEVVEALPDVRVTAIDRLWSDHNLILLHVSKSDFGPTPFKLFRYWKVLSHKKFRLLKARIKQWHSETKTSDRVTKHNNLQRIKSIEEKIEAGSTNDDDSDSRIKLLHKKRDSLRLHVYFRWKFKKLVGSWDCGSSKALGPDEFSFTFVKKYWDDIKVVVLEYVNIFLDTGSLPHGSNFSFFTLIPKIFYLASGLKINIQKSNIYGIGVSDVDVSSMASNYGCASGSFPFTYFGLPIGPNMSLTSSWQVLLERFQSKLSSWKANLLSIGERHTLIKVVLGSIEINEVEDTCVWSLGTDGTFSIKVARCIIDSKILPYLASSAVWDKNIHQKVNIFIWRLILDSLPHKLNLSSRSVDIHAISYPSCNGNVESSNHIFFECNITKDIWMLIRKWCDISFPPFTSYENWKCWFTSWQVVKEKSRRLSVIFSSCLRWLWRYRNRVTFRSHPMRKSDIFDSIRLFSYSWLHHRGHMICIWID